MAAISQALLTPPGSSQAEPLHFASSVWTPKVPAPNQPNFPAMVVTEFGAV